MFGALNVEPTALSLTGWWWDALVYHHRRRNRITMSRTRSRRESRRRVQRVLTIFRGQVGEFHPTTEKGDERTRKKRKTVMRELVTLADNLMDPGDLVLTTHGHYALPGNQRRKRQMKAFKVLFLENSTTLALASWPLQIDIKYQERCCKEK